VAKASFFDRVLSKKSRLQSVDFLFASHYNPSGLQYASHQTKDFN
jgi:hypothetical protein